MKTQLLNRMGSFLLGGGTGVTVALASLALWTGTTNLQAIKQAVVQLDSQAEGQALAYIDNYKVTVDNANAEIGEYKVALEQANSNISQLITAYENKVDELENANSTYEQDMKDLEKALANMEQRLDQQYTTDMNEVVEKANEQINQANTEVGETKTYVDEVLKNSKTNGKAQDRIAETGKTLDITEGEPTVTDIPSNIPTQKPTEQPQE